MSSRSMAHLYSVIYQHTLTTGLQNLLMYPMESRSMCEVLVHEAGFLLSNLQASLWLVCLPRKEGGQHVSADCRKSHARRAGRPGS